MLCKQKQKEVFLYSSNNLLNILCIAQIVFPQVNSFQALIHAMAVLITEISH